jgi:hypothetical protein
MLSVWNRYSQKFPLQGFASERCLLLRGIAPERCLAPAFFLLCERVVRAV